MAMRNVKVQPHAKASLDLFFPREEGGGAEINTEWNRQMIAPTRVDYINVNGKGESN